LTQNIPIQKGLGNLIFSMQLEKGELQTNIDFSHLDKGLKSQLFLESPNGEVPLDRLNFSSPQLALSLSLNMDKLHQVLAQYYPENRLDIVKKWGAKGILLAAIIQGDLANLTNGNVGFVVPQNNPKSWQLALNLG